MPYLCLVPTPLRALRAGRRLCDAEDGLLFGRRVATLDDLVPGLLAAGRCRSSLLTPIAEKLLAIEAARAAAGRFATLSPPSGLARAVTRAIAELRGAEVGAAAAAEAVRDLDGRARERLAALAATLGAYESSLGALGALDRAAALRGACEVLRGGRSSEETSGIDLLVLDGFHALAPGEWDLVAALAARSGRTRVHLAYFPDRPDLSRAAEPMLRRLESLHELAATRDIEVVLGRGEAGPDRDPALAAVLRGIAAGSGSGEPSGGRVLAMPGAGEEGEAEAAARVAAGWIAEGVPAGEIAFVSPSPSRVAPLLAAACAAQGVPFATGRGAPLAEAAPVRAVRAALHAAPRLGRRAAEELAGSTYLALARAPARLAWCLDRAGALDGRNDPETALRDRASRLSAGGAAPERAALERSASALAEIAEALRPLGAPGTARSFASRLRAFVGAAGVRRRAAHGEPIVARRDLAALSRLEEVADDLAGAMALVSRGDEHLSVSEYAGLLDLALESAAVPVAPEPASGAVELWPLAEAPGLTARGVVLLGCGRGSFPPQPRPEPLLREAERAAVNRVLGHAALATLPARRAEAVHLAFCAVAAAREALAFTWPAAGPGGEGCAPAPLVIEALAACGAELPRATPPAPSLDTCRSDAEALRAAARLFRAGQGRRALSVLAVARPELAMRAESAFARGAIDAERRDAALARRASPWAGLVPEAIRAELARALPVEWSPTQLEAFANCPYQLFLSLLVGLPDAGTADLDIDPRDEGGLAHAVLERFLRGRRDRSEWPLAGSDAEKTEARAVAEALFASYEAEGKVGDPALWAARRETLLARIDRVVEAEARDHDGLAPKLLEHRFGGASASPPLAVESDGERVLLKGRIDRVDAAADRLRVIDYKNSRDRQSYRAQLDEEALGVTNFQLPAYLLAAARDLPGRARLEATYALLRAAERLPPLALDADHPFLASGGRADAEGGTTFARAVVAAVRRIRAGDLPIAPRDCSRCPYGAVCRFQAVTEAET